MDDVPEALVNIIRRELLQETDGMTIEFPKLHLQMSQQIPPFLR